MNIQRLSIIIILFAINIISAYNYLNAQSPDEDKLKLSGELFTDDRFLLKDNNDWAWNENRLTLNLDKKITGNSKFRSEVWLRNIGLPNLTEASDLYNKGIVDPYNLEIREAYVQINGFLSKNLDLSIGRQRIAWGTGDKLNPTDNLNPYDMEDILDFGRHRGSGAVNMTYYLNNDFSVQAVFVPFFQPANMPVGMFANALNPGMELPQGMSLTGYSDTLLMPRYSVGQSSTSGLRFKGFAKGIDFSLSYVWSIDGIPFNTANTINPVDTLGGVFINSQLSFARMHVFGADLATSLFGFGVWAEAALFIPEKDIVMSTILPAVINGVAISLTWDSVLVDKTEPYLKFILGVDYFFADGSYFNLQYMHGFIHEKGRDNLNDYFFFQYEKRFVNDKLKIAPLSGGFIVTDWSDVSNNYALIYMPQIAYQATANAELSLSTVIFDGKGESMFASLKDYNMFLFKMKYSF